MDSRSTTSVVGQLTVPPCCSPRGGGQSLLCWRRQMEPLSQQFQVIAWDAPGQGATLLSSPPPDQLSAEIFADAMEAVVHELHLREAGYIIIAWSVGGWMTSNFLLKYGTKGLRGIVLVGSGLRFLKLFQGLEEPFAKRSAEMVRNFSARPPSLATRDQLLLAFVRWLTESALPEEEFYLTLGYTAWCALNGYLRFDLFFDHLPGDVVALVREQRIPVLSLLGEHDAIVPPRKVQADAAELGAELHIFKSGHSPFLEDSDAFNEQVLAFARRVFALPETRAS